MIQANLLLSRPFIKINACLIGYLIWLMFSQHHTIIQQFHIPICFYNVPFKTKVYAPDTIAITVKAPRALLKHIAIDQTACHIDLATYQSGTHLIMAQKENLFLPDEIILVNLTPSAIQVQLQKNE